MTKYIAPSNRDFGYTHKELLNYVELAKENPNFKEDKFWEALRGCTWMLVDWIGYTYECDVRKAIRCWLENRVLTFAEWD